jgi:hypothetical protein
MFEELYKHLKLKGFGVYSIGQHEGICTEPYLVIKEMGTTSTLEKNVNKELVEVYVYYPKGRYSSVRTYLDEVESSMNEIKGIEPAYQPTPILIDDDKQAYFTRLSYEKKKKRRF